MSDNSKSAVWNQRYAVDEYIFGTEPSDILTRHARYFKAGETLLAIADGEGRNGVYLAGLGLQVTSFDISPIGIAKAKRLAARRQAVLTILESDIETWDWLPESVDVVVGIFFQFLDPIARAKTFANIITTLKPGGRVFLRGYTPRQHHYKTGGPSEVENLYTPELLLKAFPGFEILHLEEQEVELNEGPRHTGMSAFVDFIARKV
jgi:SAM-dependent methyltransferase